MNVIYRVKKFSFIEIGDLVEIKGWYEMTEEFGQSSSGSIRCDFGFTKGMKYLCGRQFVVKERYLSDKKINIIDDWNISKDMVKIIRKA